MAVLFFFFLSFNNSHPNKYGASLVAQVIKNPPAMRETWIQHLGWEHPLEKEMATHSNILT